MNKVVRAGFLALGVGLVLAAGTAAGSAQDDKLAIIKERQDFMKAQQKDVGVIVGFSKGTADRDAAVVAANDLVARSGELETKLAAFFPAGTSNVEFPGKTLAKPELWQNMADAKAAPAKLRDAEVKLADVVKTGDPAAVGKAMADTYRDTCNALCHNSFRAPEEKH